MHDDDVPLSRHDAASMIRRQFPEFASEPIAVRNGAGTTNYVFQIGEHYAARFPRRLTHPDICLETLRTEAGAMTDLNRHCSVRTPTPYAIGTPSDAYPMPWSIQSWITGEVATPYGQASSASFTQDLANLILSLHAADTQGRPFCGQGRGGSLTDHDGWMEHCFSQSETLLNVPRLRQMWSWLRTLPDPGSLVMSHKDLIPANVLIADERLVGVLDGGGFGPADPALDLVAGWHMLDTQNRDMFRQYLGCDDVDWLRGAAWAFQQAMGLVWYYQRSNPDLCDLGRSTLNRLSEDVSL